MLNETAGNLAELIMGPTYWRIRQGEIAGQVSFPPDGYAGTVIDIDADGRILGIEGIDGLPDLRVILADPRLRIVRGSTS